MSNTKTVYLVDYENVHDAGLAGTEKLTEEDMLCIFTAQPSTNFNIKVLSSLNAVDLRFFIVTPCKQAVDMCISSYLGYLVAKNEGSKINYVVISKDTDYDSMLQFWAIKGLGSFSRQTKLSGDEIMTEFQSNAADETADAAPIQIPVPIQSLICQKNEAIQKLLSEKGIENEKVNYIASLVSRNFEEKNIKQVVYRSLTSKFGQQEGLQLYNLIKKSL